MPCASCLLISHRGRIGGHTSFRWPAGWIAIDLFGLRCYNRPRTVAVDRCLLQRAGRPAQVQVAGFVGCHQAKSSSRLCMMAFVLNNRPSVMMIGVANRVGNYSATGAGHLNLRHQRCLPSQFEPSIGCASARHLSSNPSCLFAPSAPHESLIPLARSDVKETQGSQLRHGKQVAEP